jgi:hypothetical protein
MVVRKDYKKTQADRGLVVSQGSDPRQRRRSEFIASLKALLRSQQLGDLLISSTIAVPPVSLARRLFLTGVYLWPGRETGTERIANMTAYFEHFLNLNTNEINIIVSAVKSGESPLAR